MKQPKTAFYLAFAVVVAAVAAGSGEVPPTQPCAPRPAPSPVPDRAPEPYLLNPAQQETLRGDIPIVHDCETLLMAEDLTDEFDIRSTVFEFSADGLHWRLVGVDKNANYEGPIPTNRIDEERSVLSCCVSEGRAGFATVWDTSALAEGVYLIRITMKDASSQRAAAIFPVYLDPTPPLLELGPTPQDGEAVAGRVDLLVSSPANGLQFQMAFLQDSTDPVDQRGLANDRQTDIFPVRNDGTNMFCAPTGAKNSLWRLAMGEGRFRQVPDRQLAGYVECFRAHARAMGQAFDATNYRDPSTRMLTNLGLAVILACKMRTQADTGTSDDNVLGGLRQFLREQGLASAYTATTVGASFRNFHSGLNRGEDVGVKVCYTIEGQRYCHFLTGKDAGFGPRGGPHTASFVDPATGGNFTTTWNNNNVIQYPAQIRRRNGTTVTLNVPASVERVWTVSPTGSPVWIPVPVDCVEGPKGAYACSFDSTALANGFSSLRLVATDTQNNVGVTFIGVFVNN